MSKKSLKSRSIKLCKNLLKIAIIVLVASLRGDQELTENTVLEALSQKCIIVYAVDEGSSKYCDDR